MKKKYMIIIINLCFILSIVILAIMKYKIKGIKHFSDSSSGISIMLKQNDGSYKENNSFSWDYDNYILNIDKSSCEKGNISSWDNSERKVLFDANEEAKCILYFDLYAKDLSGNNNHATFVNVTVDNEGVTTCDSGYINTNITNQDFSNGYSYVIKVKVNDFSTGSRAIMGNWNQITTGGGGIYSSWDAKFNADIYFNGVTTVTSSARIAKTWYTLIETYDYKEIKLYVIDNSTIDEYTELKEATPTIEYTPILIGADPDYNQETGELTTHNNTNITVEEALVFNRVLTLEEINSDYLNKINPQNKEGLIAWYKFTNLE